MFIFVSVGPAVPTFSKKEQFPFPPGSQVHGTTVCDALLPHSRPRPILPEAKRVRFGDVVPPHAPLASPVWDPGSSSRWLTHTIRLGYAIQFTKRPAKFNCVLETSVAVRNAPVLREEIAVLLAKDAIEPVPRAALSQPLLHRTQERRWSPTNPGSASLEPAFAQAPVQDADVQVQMQPAPGLACSDRLERMLTFMFRSFCDTDRSYGLHSRVRLGSTGSSSSGSPCLPVPLQRSQRAPLPPLREVGIRVPNYLDDWPILAPSREQLCDHRDLVLRHLSQLGFRVNWEKSKLSPVQRISFLGVELDSMSMTACLTDEHAQAVLNCLSSFRGRNVVPLK